MNNSPLGFPEMKLPSYTPKIESFSIGKPTIAEVNSYMVGNRWLSHRHCLGIKHETDSSLNFYPLLTIIRWSSLVMNFRCRLFVG